VGVRYVIASDVCNVIHTLLRYNGFRHIRGDRVYCVRSYGSKSKSYARIYGLPRPWVLVLGSPGYVIEVVSENFDRLSRVDKIKVLIHELLHIPYTFSGHLRPHGRLVNGRLVNMIYGDIVKEGLIDMVDL